MRWPRAALLCIGLACAGCSGAGRNDADTSAHRARPARPPEPSPAEVAADIETTLVRFSLALAEGNDRALRDLTTEHFTLLDEGRVYDRDGMLRSVRQVLAGGSMIRTPLDFTTPVGQ